jgi:hypothetical protein
MLFRERLIRTFRDPIDASVGLKLVITMTGVVAVIMVIGTIFFVARIMMQA